jgi:hypothetical protein
MDELVQPYLEAKRDLDPAKGMAIPGQIHVIDAEGTVHNFVGAQTVPLVNKRDGGPYLDDVERAREQLRKDYVLGAPSSVGVEDAPIIHGSPSVIRESTDDKPAEPVDDDLFADLDIDVPGDKKDDE